MPTVFELAKRGADPQLNIKRRTRVRSTIAASTLLGAACLATPAWAETVTYTYDALRRLVKVENSGGSQNGVTSTYEYDPASNRTRVQVTGAASSAGPGGGASTTPMKVIVTPLGGYAIIFAR